MKFLNVTLSNIVLTATLLCSNSFAEEPKGPKTPPKVDVYIVAPSKDIEVPLEYPARFVSMRDATITARVTGVLQKKLYIEGQYVRKGDLLYKIEPDTYIASVESAKAALALENAKQQKAQKDWARADALYKDKAISEQEKDSAYYAFQTANASVNVAKAALRKVNVDLGYTNVRATISGVTGMKIADVGELVKEGTPLVSITQTDPIYAEFSIPNINAMKQKYQLSSGSWSNLQKANLKVSLLIDGKPYRNLGKVDFVDSHLDKSTSTLKARAVFQNASSGILAGGFARVKLMGIISKNVITVPQKAVLQSPLGTSVFVVVNKKIVPRPVKILGTADQNFIVEGVSVKDVLVLNNFFHIKPGDAVIVDKIVK
jgi:membrane fusion protein (multidrug efflux system)